MSVLDVESRTQSASECKHRLALVDFRKTLNPECASSFERIALRLLHNKLDVWRIKWAQDSVTICAVVLVLSLSRSAIVVQFSEQHPTTFWEKLLGYWNFLQAFVKYNLTITLLRREVLLATSRPSYLARKLIVVSTVCFYFEGSFQVGPSLNHLEMFSFCVEFFLKA